MAQSEIEHHYRVADLMLTMHSALRDRFEKKTLWLECGLIANSILLVSQVVIDPTLRSQIGFSVETGVVVLRVSAVLGLVLSVLLLKLDWRGKAAAHKAAVDALGPLKLELHAGKKSASLSPEAERELLANAKKTLSSVAKVPEGSFTNLKSLHVRKIELSKLVDAYPSTPILLLKLKLLLFGITSVFKHDDGTSEGAKDIPGKGGTDLPNS